MTTPSVAGKASPTRFDVHATDVLMRWCDGIGASWFSVITPVDQRGVVLVQTQQGDQFHALVSTFAMRYSLNESGRFNLHWRISPIAAVTTHSKSNNV